MIVNIIFLLLLIFLFLLLSMIWPPDSPWSPKWRTSKKTAREMCKLADVKSSDIVYDLGSGEGTALLIAAKEFGAKGVGIEIDPVRFFYSKLLLKLNNVSNVKIIRGNIFNEKISDATVVFVYLVPEALKKILPKFKRELKKGTRIVSLNYEINMPVKKYDKNNKIRFYVI